MRWCPASSQSACRCRSRCSGRGVAGAASCHRGGAPCSYGGRCRAPVRPLVPRGADQRAVRRDTGMTATAEGLRAQAHFRALLNALARPGTRVQLDPVGAAPLPPEAGPLAIAETLLDSEVNFTIIGSGEETVAAKRFEQDVRLRTGAVPASIPGSRLRLHLRLARQRAPRPQGRETSCFPIRAPH